MLNFLKRNGVSVSHCVFFKPKHPGSRRNAKINVALSDAQTVESPGFWPRGISCRSWLSEKDWESKIAQSKPAENGTSKEDDWESEES
jgi:hypothetical protein